MRRRLPVALGLLLLLSGCPHFDPVGRYSCGTENDCPNGETCTATGQCVGRPDWATCSSGRDCPSGYQCLPKWKGGANVCQRDCKTYDDCLGGFECDGNHCVPNYCSPDGPRAWDTMPVQTVGFFLGPCSAHPGSPSDGTCVGPLGESTGLLQNVQDNIGLCYAGGPMKPGVSCLENVTNGATDHQCEPGAFCGAGVRGYHFGQCRQLCGPQQPTCFTNERCYLVWGSNGICVPQPAGSTGVPVGEACHQQYPDGGSLDIECLGASVCAESPDAGLRCEPTCASTYDCSSDGGTSIECNTLPGGPPGSYYCYE